MPNTSVPVISWTSLKIIIKFFLELDLTLTNYLPIVFKNVQIMPLSTMAIIRQHNKTYPTTHRATMVFNSKFCEQLRTVQSLILLKRITVRICHLNEPTSEFYTHSKSSTTENFYFTVQFHEYLFIYQLFWTQSCPERMRTNRTQFPCEVPSLPNPTTRKG